MFEFVFLMPVANCRYTSNRVSIICVHVQITSCYYCYVVFGLPVWMCAGVSGTEQLWQYLCKLMCEHFQVYLSQFLIILI